jgi:hypothetical protein
MEATAAKQGVDSGYHRPATRDGHILAFPVRNKPAKPLLKDVLVGWLFPTARLGV